jgi:hypothetical protein
MPIYMVKSHCLLMFPCASNISQGLNSSCSAKALLCFLWRPGTGHRISAGQNADTFGLKYIEVIEVQVY